MGNAQTPYIDFNRIGLEQGLLQGHVYDIWEGNDGYMWFGTFAGLARYDGYQFHTYARSQFNVTKLTYGYVSKIYEDRAGNMWIGTNRGMDLFDKKLEKVERYYYPSDQDSAFLFVEYGDIFEDKDSTLWLGTSAGLAFFDKKAKKVIPCKAIEGEVFENKKIKINSIAQDLSGNLWAGTSEGLYKIDPATKTYHLIPFATNPIIYALHAGQEGKVWIGSETGLFEINPANLEIEKTSWDKGLEKFAIRSILEDRHGTLWIGFDDRGLAKWDIATGKVMQFSYSTSDPNSLINNQIFDIEEDRFGNIWIATFNGINRVNLDGQKFRLYMNEPGIDNEANYTFSFYEDKEIGMLTGAFGGLYHSKKLGEQAKRYSNDPFDRESLRKNRVRAIFRDSDGTVWVGTGGGGLHQFDPFKEKVKRLELGPGLDESSIYQIKEFEGSIWLATSNGLFSIKKENYTVRRHMEDIEATAKEVRTFHFGPDGNIWVGMRPGIWKYNPKTNEKKPISGDATSWGKRVLNIVEYPEGMLWLCVGLGVTSVNMATEEIINYLPEDEKLQVGVAAMQIDHYNDIWFTAWQYIVKFDIATKKFESFDMSGTLNKEFNVGASYINEDGQLYFGGINGFFTFLSDEIIDDKQAPVVKLSGFKVFNQTYDLGVSPAYIKEIKLDHTENVFTFEYAGLHYSAPSNNQYAYMLEGFNEGWQYVGTKREATYTNLDPGDYIFRVKAANGDGVWSEDEMAIKLTVIPAIWQTSWFRILMTLLAFYIGYVVYQARKHQVLLRQQKEIAEQSAAYKSRFLANISHEIRTPMNAIVGLSKLMVDSGLNRKQNEYITAIRQSSENLLIIINDLLDHSKIESGKFSFYNKPFELDVSIQQLYHTLKIKAEEKGLAFTTLIEKNVPFHLIGDPIRLNQILLNLAGNAIKFTEKGKVEVSVDKVSETDKEVELLFKVTDTGIGIPADKLNVIFDSFQQANEDTYSEYGGTGLGLSISKQLVEQQGGELTIQSEQEKGSELAFNLRFEKAAIPVVSPKDLNAPIVLKNLKVLIVEDTLFNQMLAVELLKKHIEGVKIEVADNGKIALEKLEQESFDLILMDVKMPVMDGYEATIAIRKNPNPVLSNMPIIGLTANAIPEQLEKCQSVGMNDVVTKPINSDELFNKIKMVKNIFGDQRNNFK